MDWFFEYRYLVFGAGALLVYLLLSGSDGLKVFRESLLQLMLRAEKSAQKGEFGVITGPQLMDLVVSKFLSVVKPLLPFWIQPLITEELVRKVAQELYDKAFDWLDDGKFNHSAAS